MRVSAKADYAVRAAAELAAAGDDGPVKGERLAEAQEIPLQFLEHILLGSIPGVVIGAAMSDKAPQGFLRTSLGLVLIGSGIVTVQKGDPEVWPIAAAIAAIGLATILYAPHWLNRRREQQLQQEADQRATLARTLPAD